MRVSGGIATDDLPDFLRQEHVPVDSLQLPMPPQGISLEAIEKELIERASGAIERGYAVATHAIGDAANRLSLDAYEVLRSRYPEALLRIEHAQIVHPRDVVLSAEHAAKFEEINPDRIRYELTSQGKIAHLLKRW